MAGRTIVAWGKDKDSPFFVQLRVGSSKPLTSLLESALAFAVSDNEMDKALEAFAHSILVSVRNSLKQTAYSARAKAVLAASLAFEVRANSLHVTALHPAFQPLILGQKKQQMSWLTKARAPIPIVTEDGDLIFRSATPRSMANGRWVHPGRASTGIMERAIEEAKVAARKQLKKSLVSRLRKAFLL